MRASVQIVSGKFFNGLNGAKRLNGLNDLNPFLFFRDLENRGISPRRQAKAISAHGINLGDGYALRIDRRDDNTFITFEPYLGKVDVPRPA